MLWFCFVVFVLCFSGLSIFDCPFCILFRFMSLVKTSIRYLHRRMGHGFRFLLPPFSLLPPPFFQNFHINHSFFKIFIIIHFFFIWQYQKMSYIMNNTCILCPQFFVLYCISRKTVDTEYTYYSWCMTSTDIVKWRKNEWLWKFWKRNDLYGNFEKRGGSREKGGGGNEIHAPCACD